MGAPIILKKRSRFSFESIFLGWIPEGVIPQALLWVCLPAFLFILTMGVGYVQTCSFLPSFPLLVFLGCLACVLWRTIGLSIAYGALALFLFLYFDRVPVEDRLWQMGAVFVLALDYFILLLSLEEIESVLGSLFSTSNGVSIELKKTQESLALLQQAHQEEVESLQETIEKLKAEAEQRKIDKQQDLESLQWIQSEIEMLTGQKEEFIIEAREARKMSLDRREEMEKLEERLQTHLLDKKEAEHYLIGYQEKILALHVEKRSLASHYHELLGVKEEAKKRIEELDKALQDSQAKIASLETALREKENAIPEPLPVDKEMVGELSRQEGCYKQLRSQFDEKSSILSQTRKELFQTQGKLMALERENILSSPELEAEESLHVGHLITKAAQEMQQLEEEIISLEQFVSHLLSQ